MLDRLRGSEKTGVEGGEPLKFVITSKLSSIIPSIASQVLPFAGRSMEPQTLSSRWTWASVSRLCFSNTVCKSVRLRSLRHLRKRLHDLVFGVIDVLQALVERSSSLLSCLAMSVFLLHAQTKQISVATRRRFR